MINSAPKNHKDVKLPNGDALPDQGAVFIGEKGTLLLPYFMQLPKLIVDGKHKEFDVAQFPELGEVIRDYNEEGKWYYHQYVDACLGKGTCTAPFSYAARLTETILLGVIAGRFPNKTLHWNSATQTFREKEANQFLS